MTEHTEESGKTTPNDWYAIQFERNKMGIAEFIELHDNGALEYRTPDGRHGIRAAGNWEGVQQKGETGLLAMYDDDVFSPQAERIIEGRYNVVD